MAYKTFANGFTLPASDLNNYLMNQSVIVFASSTERSTTLTSPTEGMVTYLEDTNTLEVYDGSAWTDINDNTAAIPKSTVTAQGDLIVADGASSVTNLSVGANGSLLYSDGTDPSWLANSGTPGDLLQVSATGGLEFAAPAGGGGMTLLSSNSISGVVDYQVTGVSQSYTHLYVFAYNFQSSSNYQLNYRPFRFTTTDFTVRNLLVNSWSGSVQGRSQSPIQSRNIIHANQSGSRRTFAMLLRNYTSNSAKTFECNLNYVDSGGGDNSEYTSGVLAETNPVTGFSFSTNNANWTSGTLEIWGIS